VYQQLIVVRKMQLQSILQAEGSVDTGRCACRAGAACAVDCGCAVV